MELVLASRNPKKIAELQAMLARHCPSVRVLSTDDIGFTEEVEETGSTFEENALLKASAVTALGYAAVADDSGLCVDALGGAPGVYSARYAGEHGCDAKNNEKLLAELEKTGDSQRTAHFVCAIACTFPGQEPILVRGSCDGVILPAPRGTAGFGYDPLFYFPALGKTFAQLTAEEKASVSHRGNAMELFAEALALRLRTLDTTGDPRFGKEEL